VVNERSILLNNKFYNLPKEKQNAIINAGFQVFSENSYKKSPVSEIARRANISKALLFHYFKNKKEFYFFLYDYAVNLMMEMAGEEVTTTDTDFFEIFLKSVRCKCRLTKQYPYMTRFIMKPYYEEDAEVAEELKEKNVAVTNNSVHSILERIDRDKFKEDVDIEELINIIIWCGDGYMKKNYQNLDVNIDEVEKGYEEMLDFFRKRCYKQAYLT
jgi:TetR/AcrR family transcriptional regulator